MQVQATGILLPIQGVQATDMWLRLQEVQVTDRFTMNQRMFFGVKGNPIHIYMK